MEVMKSLSFSIINRINQKTYNIMNFQLKLQAFVLISYTIYNIYI